MKNKIAIIIVFFIPTFCFAQSSTPSVINASGGSSKKGYFHFEWSVGEMALINQMESIPDRFAVTNGFLQPYLSNPATVNPYRQFGVDEIKVFPTPASQYVEINFFTKQKGQLKISFYDGIGQIFYSTEFHIYGVDVIHRIPVNGLPAGTYMLHIVLNADQGFFSKNGNFKIIKIE